MSRTIGFLLAAFVGLYTSCSGTGTDSEVAAEVAEIGSDEVSRSESFPDSWKSFSATDVELLKELKAIGDSRCGCATQAMQEQVLSWMVDTLKSLMVLVQEMEMLQGAEKEAAAVSYNLRSQPLEKFGKQMRAVTHSPCVKHARTRSQEIEFALRTGKRSEEEKAQLMTAYIEALGVARCPWVTMFRM